MGVIRVSGGKLRVQNTEEMGVEGAGDVWYGSLVDLGVVLGGNRILGWSSSRLYISAKTTDHHVSAVLTKLGIPNRRALVVSAAELGLA